MDLTSVATIKFLLQKYGIHPSKRLGQNFLANGEILNEIVRTIFTENYNLDSRFRGNDNKINKNGIMILEIGPGLGTLTRELCQRAKQVIAVEKDLMMCKMLRETCSECENLTVVNEDILKSKILNPKSEILNKSKIQNAKCKIVGNIPYSITSPLIRKLLNSSIIHNSLFLIRDIVLMVQKEVAERICAKEGESKRGFLSVLAQYYSKPEIVKIVPSEAFWPKPEVESAILRIVPNGRHSVRGHGIQAFILDSRFCGNDSENFFRLVKIGFSARRKTLVNNLSAGLKIPKQKTAEIMNRAGLNPRVRAQDLSIEDWKRLLYS